MIIAAASQLQEDLERLKNWGQTWTVEFEPTESQCLTVSNMKDIQNHSPIMFQCQVVSFLSFSQTGMEETSKEYHSHCWSAYFNAAEIGSSI